MRWVAIAKRLLTALPLAAGIVLVTFFLLRLMPGDPVDIAMGAAGNVTQEEIDSLRQSLNLDKPLWEQAGIFLSGLVRGDLGESMRSRQPVTKSLKEALPATLELSFAAVLLSVLVALPVGVISAARPRSLWDRVMMSSAFLGISMPPFWLGLVLMTIFSVMLGWLPTSGRLDAGAAVPTITGFLLLDTLLTGRVAEFGQAVRHLILPALTLGAELTSILSRVVRSSMLEVMGMDYIRTARAKGLAEWRVVLRHGLRNALIPAVTILGLQFGVLMGGNMIVETIFSWPGLGRLVVDAIFARDYPVVQGAVLLYAVTFLLINLLVDVLYTWLSPRIEL